MAESEYMADPAQPSDSQQLDIESLVAEHGPVLFRYAYRLTGSAADAEDLTQHVFLTALAKLDQLRDPTAARAWLCAVLRRAYLRTQRRTRPQAVADLQLDMNVLAVDIPEKIEFDSDDLQRAINDLPDDFRLVLVGFYFEDCSYKDLAERLELPIGTVMSRLSRSKAYLRSQLLDSQDTHQPVRKPFTANGPHAAAEERLRGKAL
jgi:RNA polymerase sigma-70 factor (ECF subfamily)